MCVLAAKRGEQEEEEAKWLEGVFIYSLPSGLLWFQGDMATLVLGPLALVWLWPPSALPKPSALNFLARLCSLFRLFIVSPSVLAAVCALLSPRRAQPYLSCFGSFSSSLLFCSLGPTARAVAQQISLHNCGTATTLARNSGP